MNDGFISTFNSGFTQRIAQVKVRPMNVTVAPVTESWYIPIWDKLILKWREATRDKQNACIAPNYSPRTTKVQILLNGPCTTSGHARTDCADYGTEQCVSPLSGSNERQPIGTNNRQLTGSSDKSSQHKM
jgi:hypothetical protein